MNTTSTNNTTNFATIDDIINFYSIKHQPDTKTDPSDEEETKNQPS